MLRHRKLTVSKILSGFRDLGGVPPVPGTVFLSCDPAFNRYTRLWLKGPTLDATHGALEILDLLDPGRKDLDEDGILRLLKTRFRPQTGTFATDGIEMSAGIYGLYNAVMIMKVLLRRKPSQPLGRDGFREVMKRLGHSPGKALSRLTVFLRRCVAEDFPGGLVDHPEMSPRIATVTTLHMAVNSLWNLYGEEPVELLDGILHLDDVKVFLRRCLHRSVQDETPVAAFSINPAVGELCTNTTFFALETLKHLGLDTLIPKATKREIVSFLVHVAWRPEGGFGSTRGEAPSLNATFFGLRALASLSKADFAELVDGNLPALCGFVESCGRDGAFAFTNQLSNYLPNPLATRYALQIRQKLQEQGFAVPAVGPSADATLRFLQNELRDASSGAYQGYPRDLIDDAESFTNRELYDWRDETTAKMEAGFTLLAGALKKAWNAPLRHPAPTPRVEEIRIRGGEIVQRPIPVS